MLLDVCETVSHSSIQHGPHSNRVYLMKLDKRDMPEMLQHLDELANLKGYTKLFAKIPSSQADAFLENGYQKEASVPGFYMGKEDAVFLGKYLDRERSQIQNFETIKQNLELTNEKTRTPKKANSLPKDFTLITCQPAHAEEMAQIYKVVFPTYPFPIHNPDYLCETMESHIDYFAVKHRGKLVALSSAEMDKTNQNVEMTDFATLPDYLGNSLARHLLHEMEEAMRKRDMRTAYTIARALSPGMNITFGNLGYQYGGTLINNTQISGAIESMNVWHKRLLGTK